jgi:hypothetical protein
MHMDGTFGLCDSKIVLYALDDSARGKTSS